MSRKRSQNGDDIETLTMKFYEAYCTWASWQGSLSESDRFKSMFSQIEDVKEIQKNFSEATANLVKKVARKLGTVSGSEAEIHSTIIIQAELLFLKCEDAKNAVNIIIDKALKSGNTVCDYFISNYLFRFFGDIDEIIIGPVRALKTSKFMTEEKYNHPKIKYYAAAGTAFKCENIGEGFNLFINDVCWIVKMTSSEYNFEEESRWLIDIAISYLRLYYANWEGYFPAIGDVEPLPTRITSHRDEAVIFMQSSVSVGGIYRRHSYDIDNKVHDLTIEQKFKDIAQKLFSSPGDTLAARVSRGMGWLTRGRQAQDRAERFLYFFTAIESLLSNNDKTAPITQTIARHAAVIMTDKIDDRLEIYKKIIELYELRSKLVHRGDRSIHHADSKDAQSIAESLFSIVLKRADLDSKYEAFSKDLSSCSHGLPWPIKKRE